MKNAKRKTNKNKGFTLAEVLLTVAIIIVLLGIGVVAYAQWMRVARFRHNNDVAGTAFSVLQAELSEERSANTLGNLKNTLKTQTDNNLNSAHSGKLDGYLNSIKSASGTSPKSYQAIYAGYTDKSGNSPVTVGPIYYVKGTAQDWRTYQSKKTTDDPCLDAVYAMLTKYTFSGDDDLLDGCLCVEFDPAEGLVYSVFFSPQATDLSYDGANANLLNRTRVARFAGADLVGYYGVENLSVSTSRVTTRPIIQNVRLHNDTTLYLSLNLDVTMATPLMTYNVTLYDAASEKKLVNIEMNKITSVNGSPVGNGSIYTLQRKTSAPSNANALVDCRVQRYNADGTAVQDTEIMTFPAWVDEQGTVTLVLDAIDYNTASDAMQTSYAEAVKTKKNTLIMALANSFSIYRLGIQNTDDLYCTVYATGGGFSTTSTQTSNTANRAFETSKTASHTFTIANARHLYNLRFEETAAKNTADTYTYTLSKDVSLAGVPVYSGYKVPVDINGKRITPKGYQDTIGYTASSAASSAAGSAATTLLLKDKAAKLFPSFPQLGKNSTFTVAGTNITKPGKALQNFAFTKDNNIEWMGFAAATTKVPSANDTNGTGLFLLNSGKIEGIQLTDVTVNGIPGDANKLYSSDRTGAFCGTNKGTLNALATAATKVGACTVEGKNYVGGILGYFDPAQDTNNAEALYNIKNLTNAAAVTGFRYVGGILGLASGKEMNAQYTVTVDSCKNFGAVTAKTDADKQNQVPAYIGGIVGLVDDAAVKNCISNPQYSGTPAQKDCVGYCVGGIVGLAYDTQLDGCGTALQPGYSRGYVVGDRYVGGIVGLCVGKSVISGSEGKLAINDVNVMGNAFVGGIAGCNANIKVLDSDVATPGETEFGKDLSSLKTLPDFIIDQERNASTAPWYDQLNPQRLTPISTQPGEEQLSTITVQYWNNKGAVTGYDFYAGGIVGYNTGTVYDCITSVYKSAAAQGSCDYAGGIAGYNNGTLAYGKNQNGGNKDNGIKQVNVADITK